MNKIIKALIPLILFLMSFLISFLVCRNFFTNDTPKNTEENSHVSANNDSSLPDNSSGVIPIAEVSFSESKEDEASRDEENSKPGFSIEFDENGDPLFPKFYKKFLTKNK